MSKPATLVSFDQATKCTAWAAFDGTDLLKWDAIILPQSVSADQRIIEMTHQIEVILQRYRPKIVVIEDVQKQASEHTVILLARLQGLIIGLCDRLKIPCKLMLPTVWRKHLGLRQGKSVTRQECKEQAIEFVRKSYGLNVGEDICEAICIGLAYLKYLGMLPNLDDLKRAKRTTKHNQDEIPK